MSSRLATETALRPVGTADDAFLRRVYASAREEELSVVPWEPGQREAFLRMQFDAQDAFWAEQRPDTARSLILIGDEPAGRLYVDTTDDEVRIVDIAILPEFRRRGAGTALLEAIIDEAPASEPSRSTSSASNPARSLYERLGFREVAEHGVVPPAREEPAMNERDRALTLSRRRLVQAGGGATALASSAAFRASRSPAPTPIPPT